MGQKINPIALRLHQNRTFDAAWYDENYIRTFRMERSIRQALESFFHILSQTIPNQSLGRIFIQKSHKKTLVTFFFFKGKAHKRLKKNRFSFKYSNRNYKQIDERKNYFSALTNLQFSPFQDENMQGRYGNVKNSIFSASNGNQCMSSFLLSSGYSQISGSEKKEMLLQQQAQIKLGNEMNVSRWIFYQLLYLGFLRQESKNKSSQLLLFMGSSKMGSKPVSNLSQKNQMLSPLDHRKQSRMHPFLRIFEQGLSSFCSSNIYLQPVLCRQLNQSAIFMAEQIVQILEKNQKKKKMPGRLIKKLLADDPSMGIRVLCSGRLAGAEMARTFFLKKGQTSLNVFSQRIDFAQRIAQTKYGVIGVKVWISFLK